jgi:uncharacterized ferredoxin-like protein
MWIGINQKDAEGQDTVKTVCLKDEDYQQYLKTAQCMVEQGKAEDVLRIDAKQSGRNGGSVRIQVKAKVVAADEKGKTSRSRIW